MKDDAGFLGLAVCWLLARYVVYAAPLYLGIPIVIIITIVLMAHAGFALMQLVFGDGERINGLIRALMIVAVCRVLFMRLPW